MYFLYYYPTGVDQPRQRPPTVTFALIALMALAFGWHHYWPRLLGVDPLRLVYLPGFNPAWAIATAVFLHAGWLHLLSNLVYVAVLGPPLEDRLGHARFLVYFVMLGAWGNLTHGLAAAAGWTPPSGVLGASGAIAGLIAFALVRFYYARVTLAWWLFSPLQGVNRVGRAPVPLVVAALGWLALQGVQWLVAREAGTNVALAAHFGGFGLGLFLALALGYHREGRAAAKLARARRHLERGQAWAAEGELLSYLALAPEDVDARLQLARAQRMTGRGGDARLTYRRAYAGASAAGRQDQAVAIYREARRGDAPLPLAAPELARLAFLLEKQGDYRGAVEAYLDLYRYHQDDERAELGLVRAAVLLRDRLAETEAAQAWFAEACRAFPAGVWRDFAARELSRPPEPRAAARAAGAAPQPSPAA